MTEQEMIAVMTAVFGDGIIVDTEIHRQRPLLGRNPEPHTSWLLDYYQKSAHLYIDLPLEDEERLVGELQKQFPTEKDVVRLRGAVDINLERLTQMASQGIKADAAIINQIMQQALRGEMEWIQYRKQVIADMNGLILGQPGKGPYTHEMLTFTQEMLTFKFQQGSYRVGERGNYQFYLSLSVPKGLQGCLDKEDWKSIDSRLRRENGDKNSYRQELINGRLCHKAETVYNDRARTFGLDDLLAYRFIYGGKNEFHDPQHLVLEAENVTELRAKMTRLEACQDAVRVFVREIIMDQSSNMLLCKTHLPSGFQEKVDEIMSSKSAGYGDGAKHEDWYSARMAVVHELKLKPENAAWRDAVDSLEKNCATVGDLMAALENPGENQRDLYRRINDEILHMLPLLRPEFEKPAAPKTIPGQRTSLYNWVKNLFT